jgi:hypothetical protein
MGKPTEETNTKIALFNTTANVVKTLIMKFVSEDTFNAEVKLIVENGITDHVIQLIDSLYYRMDKNQLFHEIVVWILSNQQTINEKNNMYFEELQNLEQFIDWMKP